jgi:hypothetical protein
MEIPGGRWILESSSETFAGLCDDREFAFLVTLGRYVNALKYGMDVMNAQGDSTTPRADRQRHGSFLYVAGALHELLKFLDDSADESSKNKLCLAGLSAFLEVKQAIDSIPLTEEQRDLLYIIRNRAAFHIDRRSPARSCPRCRHTG